MLKVNKASVLVTFLVAMKKHLTRSDLRGEDLLWLVIGFQGLSVAWWKAGWSQCIWSQEAERAHFLKGSSSSQTESPIGDQMSTHRSLWGTFDVQTTTSRFTNSHCIFFLFLTNAFYSRNPVPCLTHPQPLTLPSVWWLPSCS